MKRAQLIPFYLPVVSTSLVLIFLFALGWQEQQKLIERNLQTRLTSVEQDSSMVAARIGNGFDIAGRSAQRYAEEISRRWQQSSDIVKQQSAVQLSGQIKRASDRAWRTPVEQFDASHDVGVWLPATVQPNAEQWARLAIASEVTQSYARAASEYLFVDTWYMPEFSGIVIYWPDQPQFIYNAAPDYDYRPTDWVQLTTPENNPQKETRWTALSFDPVATMWMVSAVAPLYLNGQWAGSVGHDVPLARLLGDTSALQRWSGSRFALVSRDGQVIASDLYGRQVTQQNAGVNVVDLPDASIKKAFVQDLAMQGKTHWRYNNDQEVVFVNRVGRDNSLLLHAVPLAPIVAPINAAFSRIKWLAACALLGELLVAIAILTISNRRAERAYNETQAARENLQMALTDGTRTTREMAAISYGISHDLRAPLRHMTGFTQLLREQMLTRMQTDDLRLIHKIEEANRRAGRLIEKLLTYLRVSQQTVKKKSIALQPAIERVLVEVLAEWPNARVEWQLNAHMSVQADPALLRELFYQLFDNALVALRDIDHPLVSVMASTENNMVRIDVEDNGRGFEAEKAELMFEVFQKLDAAQNNSTTGPGVGLAIVRRIVERHGGSISATGSPGAGAKFTIRFPAHRHVT